MLQVIQVQRPARGEVILDTLEKGFHDGLRRDHDAHAVRRDAPADRKTVDLPTKALGAPKTEAFLAETRALGRAAPARPRVFMVMAACMVPVFFLNEEEVR